jgi:cytochrome c-type biogenesis protein CcmF
MAALLARQRDARWIVATRAGRSRPGTFLGVGMLLGAHWAYVEVGWGGYWAWDPVENAALMPWLTATAFLHSVMVQEKKGMLKVWNVALVTATFALSIFGTFLTRSGIVVLDPRVRGSRTSALVRRLHRRHRCWLDGADRWAAACCGATTGMESLVSREATFLFNNLLSWRLAFAVLWGVIVPAHLRGRAGGRSPSRALLQLLRGRLRPAADPAHGHRPVIAWRRASLRSLRAPFGVPCHRGVVAGAILLALGYGDHPPASRRLSLSIFVAVAIVIEFARGTAARRSLAGGSWPGAFVSW